ncbi:MAG: UDP-GlcNAc:undecaprenyl-phosphate/decaprenyl-phosphate GlcNAc-phosphate transferase [Solirubrobacteraceae bacterium]|jgi:UDP-GlcNAc:undecaprenyl-phosphate GlcNAc-1-phosphate transferase|nr:UDP-GlcNAc:undecaprenyl-phosphate/decaprenyl-phosphate GlcNAc-phosphate transferase [Solirubrobacteraceae bacterium]
MNRTGLDALFAGLFAAVVTFAVTPLSARLAVRLGAVDQPRGRGLSERPTPLLGGLAIFAGSGGAMALWLLGGNKEWQAILWGAAIITLVGALDDIFDLPAPVKLAGQIGAVLPPVLTGVLVDHFTLPFVHRVDLGSAGRPLTVLGLVAIINVVNLSDGIDGLAAGVCAISAIALSIIAFDLDKGSAAVLAAITAGAAIGFLGHNFHPASIFMGDCGSNLLGYLLGMVSVQGSLKTNALVAVVIPLMVLAVPFLDTTFVVLKRMKYGRPVYVADANHFHHRFSRIGFSQRRTVLYLYAWTACLAGLALALRFVPYSDNHGHLHAGWTAVMGALSLLVLLASAYLVYVLEILKFRRFLGRQRPGQSQEEVDAEVHRSLETGEFEAVSR